MGSKLINDYQPQPKKQMSEKSLVKVSSSIQSALTNITTSTMNAQQAFESKDSHIEKVKRSFMSKCKNMQDKNTSGISTSASTIYDEN